MKLSNLKLLLLTGIASVALTGCSVSSFQTVKVEGVKPATNPTVLKYDEVFVDEFENDKTGVRSAVEKALSDKRINGKEIFEVTSYKNADAIIKGRVNDEKIRDWKYTKDRYVCGDVNCNNMIEIEDNCLKREISTNITFKALDKETNKVLLSKTYFDTTAMRMCDGDDRKFVQTDKALFKMQSYLAKQFVNYITPNYYSMKVVIVDEEPVIDLTKDEEKLVQRATGFLQQKVLTKAEELLIELRVKQPKSYIANYNLGVLSEIKGDFKQAKEYYLRSTHLIEDKDDNKELFNAIARVEKVLKEEILTNEQLN